MNKNLKMFISIFLFISAAVGIVLGLVNLLHQPASVTTGIIFMCIGIAALVAGILLNRGQRW